MLANPWVRLANNWLHDIGTGLWAACLIALAVLGPKREALAGTPDAFSLVAGVTGQLFALVAIALVVISVTGAVRLFYWRAQTPSDELAAKRPALIWKHVAFVALYAPGTWWAWTLVWRVG